MATAENSQGENLNLLLRSVAIRACLEAGFPNVYSTIKKETWRSQILQQAGHQLSVDVADWSNNPDDPETASVLKLDLKTMGEFAVGKIELEILKKPNSLSAIFLENQNDLFVDAIIVKIVAFLKA